jgi:hypothetical protein
MHSQRNSEHCCGGHAAEAATPCPAASASVARERAWPAADRARPAATRSPTVAPEQGRRTAPRRQYLRHERLRWPIALLLAAALGLRAAAAPPATADVEVGPWRLEAEDFAGANAGVADDTAAVGGKAVTAPHYLALAGLPFPRTSRPVTVAVRLRQGTAVDALRLVSRRGGKPQVIATLPPRADAIGKWVWGRFPAVLAEEVGDAFEIATDPRSAAAEPIAIDTIVLGTALPADDAALALATPLLPAGPVAAVARCPEPPRIDGDPADHAWDSCVAVRDFSRLRSQDAVEAGTDLRFCYDAANLYVRLIATEPLLEVARQRVHEFAATITQRDGEVFRDDCLIVLLDPAGEGKTLFEFTVNALGTLADARCTGPDYWGGRDLSWNSDSRAAARIEDGRWCAELAIPLAALGVAPPEPGRRWQAGCGRIAKGRTEQSCWHPCNLGIHDPLVLAQLVFTQGSAGVALSSPEPLQPGANTARLELGPSQPPWPPTGLLALTMVATPGQRRWTGENVAGPAAPSTRELTFEVPAPHIQLRHAVLDAATLQQFLLTPCLTRDVKSGTARLHLDSPGPFEVLLNATRVAAGPTASDVVIPLPLRQGVNLIAVRLTEGTASARIELPDGTPWQGQWKLAEDTPDAVQPATDDSAWATAAPGAGGTALGRPGRATVLRHTLLWEQTRVWPTPAPALFLAQGTTQHLNFIVDGVRGRTLDGWRLYVAVPAPFEVLGSSGYYGAKVTTQPQFECADQGEAEVQGKPMRVARITATKPILPRAHPIFTVCNVFVRYPEGAAVPAADPARFVFWTEANDKTATEPAQTLPVRVLPPLRGRQPHTFVWQLWGSFFNAMDDVAMREASLRTIQAAGVNDLVAGDRWTSDMAPRYGLRHTMGCCFESWSMNLEPYLAAHPDQRLTAADGRSNSLLMCTSRLLDSGWTAVAECLRERLQTVQPGTVDYDYEFSPFTGPHSCYCSACLDAFRQRAGLAADVRLDAALIKERHADAWVDFMAWRVAQVFRHFRDSVHQIAPGTQFSVYSGYQTPDNPSRYGVNWAYIGELGACDRVGCGYGRPLPAVGDTVKALRGIPLLCGELINPYNTTEALPLAPFTKATLLRRALDATGGVLLYERLPMDGRAWHAVAETTRLVAEFEDAFLHGTREAVGRSPEAVVQALHSAGLTLVCVVNEAGTPLTRQLEFPAEWGPGTEFYSGRSVQVGQAEVCRLPAGEAEFFVFRR